MKYLAQISKRRLKFRFPARTSRDVLLSKDAYYLKICRDDEPEIFGVGEFNYFPGLASDATPDYESRIKDACRNFNQGKEIGPEMSSVNFAFESAMRSLSAGSCATPFSSDWNLGRKSIEINGLIWMGDFREMKKRIDEKLTQGFKLLKLKIGGIDFEEECSLLSSIRQRYSEKDLTIRLDANGSFTPGNAMERLRRLSEYHIHSIEQPLKPGIDATALLCRESPIPIALDEELIGTRSREETAEILDRLSPSYLVIKPSLCGGFEHSDIIVDEAEKRGIGWWATSALESDIGLGAIASWTAAKNVTLPQGLGTGQLYINNIPSPIRLRGQKLYYDPSQQWDFSELLWKSL